MATRCIDISDNKRFNHTSPIAVFSWVVIAIILTALMDPSIIYLICLMLAFVFCQIFFQYKPRFIFLTLKFLMRNSYLTPSFNDDDYIADEMSIPNIRKAISDERLNKVK